MIPLRDDNPTRNVPIATIGIIAINVLVFLYELALGDRVSLFIASKGAIPYEIVHNCQSNSLWANYNIPYARSQSHLPYDIILDVYTCWIRPYRW